MAEFDVNHEIEVLEKSLERHLSWIRQSDTKSQMLIAINLVLVSAVLSETPKADAFTWRTAAIIFLGNIVPCWNLFKCFATITPHVKALNNSLVFFGTINKMTIDEYKNAVKSRTQEDYLDDLIIQTYTNAKIADIKYRRIKHAADLTFLSLPVTLFAVALLFFQVVSRLR